MDNLVLHVGTELEVCPTFAPAYTTQIKGKSGERIIHVYHAIQGDKMLFIDELQDYISRGIVKIVPKSWQKN